MLNFYDHTQQLNNYLTKAPDEEVQKLFSNKLWRIQNLYPIQDKYGRLVPLTLNKHQKKLIEMIKRNGVLEPIIILKSRQVGITTFFCLWYLDQVLNYSGISAGIQSHKRESLNDIFKIVRLAYDHMNPVNKPPETDRSMKGSRDTRTEISIGSLNSTIEVKLEIRSKAINMIHFSEYAFTEEDRITATEGSLAPQCMKVYESSPKGLNKFHKLYNNQKPMGNTFFISWHEHDEYSVKGAKLDDKNEEELDLQKTYNISDEKLAFRRSKLATMDRIQFDQEYPVNDEECFLLSGAMLIDRRLLIKMKQKAEKTKPILKLKEDNATIRFYMKPTLQDLEKRPMAFYLGVDPAEGIGKDYSAAVLLACDEGHRIYQIMSVHGHLTPNDLSMKVFELMQKYFRFETDEDELWPLAIIERNNHGHAVLSFLTSQENYCYPNLYVHKDKRLGFHTTHPSRKMIFQQLFNAIRDNQIQFNDSSIISELLTLTVTETGKYEAEEGYHDDLVLALCFAYHGYFHNEGRGRVDKDDYFVEGDEDDETQGPQLQY